jgi:hypothetical protein
MLTTNHKYGRLFPLLIFLIVVASISNAQQISVVSADVNSYNVSPRGLCQVTILNPLASVQVIMQAQLLDAANEPLVTVKTNPFTLKNGLNVAATMSFSIGSVDYGATSLVNYIRNSNVLPIGKYNYCVKITPLGNTEAGDEYCQELESDMNSYLYLVNPEDKDTVDTQYPLLIWNHSDPFNQLGPGEFYRMVVTPLTEGQSAEEAITVNTPMFFKNNLQENQVAYPYDAPNLEPGKHYAWQVQLLANDAVINKTEAWEFIEPLHITPPDNKYGTVKTKLDAGFYTATNNKVFFRFDESYATSNVAECYIYDSKNQAVKSKTYDAKRGDGNGIPLQNHGYNQYEIDLNNLNVSSGFYCLKIKNGKGQEFMLKFYVN